MINLDGSFLEGGGSVVRQALALSMLTGKGFFAENIRMGRPQPGLKPQHCAAVDAAKMLCGAHVEGNEPGSRSLRFLPRKLAVSNIDVDIGTAGSITLLLQSILPGMVFGHRSTTVTITGATDTRWSMQADYFREVFLVQIQRFCEKAAFSILKRGYYPKGNGKIEIYVKPRFRLRESLDNFNVFHKKLRESGNEINLLKQHSLIQIKGISHASSMLEGACVADRQAKAARLVLNKYGCPVSVKSEYHATASAGSGITVWGIFSKDPGEIDLGNPIRLGADCLGERGTRAEVVGARAAESLGKLIQSKAPVDEYLADNMILWLALFGGSFKASRISRHTLTNVYVVESFLGSTFDVDDADGIVTARPF